MNKAIGIIGGVGPLAGLDAAEKVVLNTNAKRDQDHIDLYLVSIPKYINDRTAYLLEGGENPVKGLQKALDKLALLEVTAFGISCNTAHSPKIINELVIPEGIKFVNMLDSTLKYISELGIRNVGLVATLGTLRTNIYDEYFASYPGLNLIKAPKYINEEVHDAIYNPETGIKATSKVSKESFRKLVRGLNELKLLGAEGVILGCTELPLAFKDEDEFNGLKLIDPTLVLARELIKSTYPEKLLK